MTTPRKSIDKAETALGCFVLMFLAFRVALGLGILGLVGTGIWLLLKIGGAL